MRDGIHRFIQTRVAPSLATIEDHVLRLGYTSISALAHLMAREMLARACVAALRRLPYPGVVSLDALLDTQFVPLLGQEIDAEFERVQAEPATWIVPGHPLDLIPRPILPLDYTPFMTLLAALWRILDFHTAGWAEADVRYIAQYILDAGVLPLLEGKASSERVSEDAIPIRPTVVMEPLVPGGPFEVAPIFDDVNELNIEWSDAAQHDGDVYDWFVRMFILAPSSTVEGFFARLNSVGWLEGILPLPHLSEREKELIVHVYVYGMDFDVAALSDGMAPDDVLLEIFEALTHLRRLWDEDHSWA